MTDNEAHRLREEYLARLDQAMHAVPHGIATDIRAGVLEEFHGLDAEGSARLIERLGDPAEIAAAAMTDGGPAAPVLMASVDGRVPTTGTRGFAIVAALALGFGGIVLPVVGWAVGAVLVCLSPLWRTWEKVVAIAVPVGVVVVAWVLIHLLPKPDAIVGGGGASRGGEFYGPSAEDFNPLIPAAYDIAWSASLVVMLVVVPASALWLLWRLRGRGPSH